jgi:hypothetical protein
MYPAGDPPKADAWTFDTFLKATEAKSDPLERFGESPSASRGRK